MKQNDKTCSCKYKIKRQHLTMNRNISNTYVLLAAPPRLAITKISNKNSVVSTKLLKKKNPKIKTVISKPCFWMKHNELQIVTLKNRDPDILDHLFQIMCFYGYRPFSARTRSLQSRIQWIIKKTQWMRQRYANAQ